MDSRLWLGPLLVGAALAGCGGSAGGNSGQANDAAELAAQPVKEEHRSMELTPAWLQGRWQTGEGNCGAGDTFFTLAPDGRYTFLEEQGRWSLEGDRLTIEVVQPSEDGAAKAGDRAVTIVKAVSPNEAVFRAEDGSETSVFRCHEG